MRVNELIERLEDADPDAEVRIVHQPHYPLQSSVRGVATAEEIAEYGDGDDEYEASIVWVVEGSQISETPYGPRAAFEVAS